MQPIYLPGEVKAAWQLNWSLTVFWRSPPMTDDWRDELRASLEPDGIRLLDHRFSQPDRSLFLFSSIPIVTPERLVNRVKGRLQYIVRHRCPKALRRNYDLHGIGSTRRDKAEQYVESQLWHHYPDDSALRTSLVDLQIVNPEIDLGRSRYTAHARYHCNLHVVLRYQSRPEKPDADELVRSVIKRAAASKGHFLSRLGLLLDHLHLILGISPDESPEVVVLSYMNNIASVYGMSPVLKPSYFVGTIGEYDLGAIGK